MAYNPFNIFRRNQKAIFAVITVFIMFTFVLSSGLGGGADFFDWLPNWLGKKTRKGDHLCTIDGTKVYQGDLAALREQRHTANKFMLLAADQSVKDLSKWAQDQRGTLSADVKKVFDDLDQGNREMLNMYQMVAGNPNLQANPQIMDMILREPRQKVEAADRKLRGFVTSTAIPPDDQRVVEAYYAAGELSRVLQRGSLVYFVNAPNKTDRDLIEFMVWEKKADQLGIKLTEADVKRLVQKEFYDWFKNDVHVRKAMQENGKAFSMDATWKALGAEFRVRMAQRAYLGPPAGEGTAPNQALSAPPVFAAPYEVFDYYREKFSPTTYRVLAIPGRSLAHLVTGAPKRDELESLWQKNKDKPADPSLPEPGLQDARKVRVGWVGLTGAEPYYRKLAAERLDQREAGGKLMAPLTVPVLGMGPGWIVAAAGSVTHAGRYQAYLQEHAAGLAGEATDLQGRPIPRWGRHNTRSRPLDAAFYHPRALASAVGTELTSMAAAAGPYAQFGSLYNGALSVERWAQARAEMQLWYGAVPGPGLANLLPLGVVGFREYTGELSPAARPPADARGEYNDTFPRPLPPAVAAWSHRPAPADEGRVGAGWSLQQLDTEGRKLAAEDLTKLRGQLDVLARDTKNVDELKGKARAAVDAFKAARNLVDGVQFGESKKSRDRWTVGDDPGLAPLEGASVLRDLHGGRSVPLGDTYFKDRTVPDRTTPGKQAVVVPARGVYRAGFFPMPDDPGERGVGPMYLTWRTEEQEPDPKDRRFNEERAVWAWKVLQGRALAKAKANELVARIQAAQPRDVEPVVKAVLKEAEYDLRTRVAAVAGPLGESKAAERIREFTLTVAPLNPRYGLFSLAQSGEIPYPTPEMEQALLDRRTELPLTAFVLEDKPKDTYYVVLIDNRKLKLADEFRRPEENRLAYAAYEVEARKQAQEAVLQLVKAEVRYAESDEQKAKIDAVDKKEGGEEQ